jgi:hypothetical protein
MRCVLVQAMNWPLRGGKNTYLEGGQRIWTALSGGYLPTTLQGKMSSALSSNTDWQVLFRSNPLPTPPAGEAPARATSCSPSFLARPAPRLSARLSRPALAGGQHFRGLQASSKRPFFSASNSIAPWRFP